jgi:hypothetical protein
MLIPDAYVQRTHQFLACMLIAQVLSMFEETALLKISLSICFRNVAAQNEPK